MHKLQRLGFGWIPSSRAIGVSDFVSITYFRRCHPFASNRHLENLNANTRLLPSSFDFWTNESYFGATD
jgi:hypothetical protein